MEKAINVKSKKINLIFGFDGDKNYGVHYPTLTESIELTMLFPYLNQGEKEITDDYGLSSALFTACSSLKGTYWDNLNERKYTLYVYIHTVKYEPTIWVSFRIEENAA